MGIKSMIFNLKEKCLLYRKGTHLLLRGGISPRHKKPRSIKVKIIGLLLVSILFLVVTGEIILHRTRQIQEEQLCLVLDRKSLTASQLLNEKMDGYLKTLISMSYAPVLQEEDIYKALAYLNEALQREREADSLFFSFSLVDMDGKMREVDCLESITDRGDAAWFQAILAGEPYYLSEPDFSRVFPDLQRIMVAVPIFKQDQLYRILHARVSLHELSEWINELRFGESGRVFVLDKHGIIIAHPFAEMLLVDSSVEGELISPQMATASRLALQQRSGRVGYYFQGRETISIFNLVPLTDWLLVIAVDREEAFAEIDGLTRHIRLVIVGASLLLLILGWYTAAVISLPLKKLTASAKRLSRGDLSTEIMTDMDATLETARLAAAFDKMRSNVKELVNKTALASTKVTAAAKSLLLRLEQEDLSTVEITSTVNKMSDTVDVLAENIAVLSMQSAVNGEGVDEETWRKYMVLEGKNEEEKSAQEETTPSLNLLSQSMEEIGQFMFTVRTVAGQAQALSLKASVVQVLVTVLEVRDKYTQGHSERVANWVKAIAVKMGLTVEEQEMAYISGLLHDIGKIGIKEVILFKEGKLTESEYQEIKLHPGIGVSVLKSAKFPSEVLEAVLWHHEDYAGGGYPEGISGTSIPLMARIIRVADAYDAMTSDRAYRKAFSCEWALAELERCQGKQFDPAVVAAMREVLDEE